MPFPGDILDGYNLIRPIGQGGFGEVWLCRSESMRDWRALKFIPAGNGSALDKEYTALVRYRKAAAQLRSPHLTPIEHVNRCPGGLFYIMPLADGGGADSPESLDWLPYTLGTYISARRAESAWFTSAEVVALFAPVLSGLQCLANAGLVHRDIKPDNILFFGGKPCLGDISLMTNDRTQVTRHGTPGYSTPSWFTGGHHDMYGAAATLYTLITGNDPDRMGRVAFMWPPQGEASLTSEERREWLRLHAVIRRAIDENPAERFVDFAAMLMAITADKAVDGNTRSLPQQHVTVAVGAHEALMARLTPLLEENERIGRDYDRKLRELLEFYETNAPAAFTGLETLVEDPLSPEAFETRISVVAPLLKALIRPELSMRDDPRVELPREEWLRRIKVAQSAKTAGVPEALTTLADARADAQILWGNVFEAAGLCPQNPDEQFWFEKRVSNRFYASPLRVTRDLPPMETLWFAKADNDGVMRPLSVGLLRKQLEKALELVTRRKADATWTPEAAQHATEQLDGLMKSALWVEIQIGVFMKPARTKTP